MNEHAEFLVARILEDSAPAEAADKGAQTRGSITDKPPGRTTTGSRR